jgi:hypothetical protein
MIQDGTGKASLELKDDKCLKAFDIKETDKQRFKDYCLKFGAFIHPSKSFSNHYRDILDVFKKYDLFKYLIFYCKPFCKLGHDKGSYTETISKPSFIVKEKEKEIYLNGEMKELKKQEGPQRKERIVKKTNICLKVLHVDDNLGREAINKVY